MAPNAEVQQRVTKVVCNVLNVDQDMVAVESDFVFDLGAESIQSVQLVAAFELEFDIEMDSEKAMAVQTVGDAVNFIGTYLS
jgi:acyl carrier protein